MCQHQWAIDHRNSTLTKLKVTLENLITPPEVIATIEFGFEHWINDPDTTQIRALIAGSLRGPDDVLTTAFYEQFWQLSWFQLYAWGESARSGQRPPHSIAKSHTFLITWSIRLLSL